jgi:galactitol-specific phosphotransferase system IIB component
VTKKEDTKTATELPKTCTGLPKDLETVLPKETINDSLVKTNTVNSNNVNQSMVTVGDISIITTKTSEEKDKKRLSGDKNDVFKDISVGLDDVPTLDKIMYDTNIIHIKRLDANLSKKDIYMGTLALLKDFMRDIQNKPSLIGQLESVIQKMQ